ncbi:MULTISPECIES: TonB-dependent receptor [unclassified Sphingomonas]|uniref:TonB-dependent receptor n=1 Tax=unclassified Sphingomonas TaxID=196159 RepID=UPI0008338071|nr:MULTISPECIES: TonB-dependent receptor [unclassified Sphingomonas]
MIKANSTMRSAFRAGGALQALALLGAGMMGSAVLALPAAAQDYTNVTTSGRVQSTNGDPVAGATIVLKSEAQGFERTTTTDRSGNFRLSQLPPGRYTVTVSAPGFDPYSEAGVLITQQSAANQFTVSPEGASGDDIIVTAGRVQVADFDRTTVGTVVNLGDLATRVPVARDISSVVQLSPGTTAGDTAFGNLPNISGSSVAENIFYINGLNITNFRTQLGAVTVPFDFYETVEVKNGGFQAEFGRATGGIVNATTKSGSNEFKGGVLFNWEADDLRSDAPNTLFEDNDARGFERTDAIVQLSGPIIKDRVFFYALYNSRDVKETRAFTALGTGGTPADPRLLGTQYRIDSQDSPFYGGKLDVIVTDGHRLEGTFFDTRNVVTRDIFGTAASGRRYNPTTNDPGNYASTSVFRTGGINYVGRYTGTFTPWLTISGAYGVNEDRDTTEPTNPGVSSVIDQRGGTSVSIGNATPNSSLNFDRREFYRGDVDIFFNLFGSHHIRGGYDRENLTTNITTEANGIGQITLSNGSPTDEFGIVDGQYATVRQFINGGEFRSTNEAYYLQDNWSLFSNRVTLQLGIRNDKFSNQTLDGTVYYDSGDQWGPRLGFSGDVFGDNTTKLYGSFGRYFLPIAANTNNRLGGAELDQDRFFRFNGLDANNTPILGQQLVPLGGSACLNGLTGTCIVRSDGQAADPRSLIAGNLQSQSVDEYILGVERRFGKFRVNLFGTWRDLNASLEDSAVDPAIRAYCTANNLNGPNADGETCQTIFNGTHQYVLINPGNNAVVTLSDPVNGESTLRTVELSADALGYPRAVRYYRAVTLQIQREFDGKWGGEFSYTWSDLKGNTEGGVRSDNGQTDTGATVDFDLPGLADGTFGFGPNHRRHNFKLFGTYAPFSWLTLGANAQITSPRRFGCLGTVPSSRDPDAARFYGANGTYCNLNADGSVRTAPAAAGEVLPPRQIVRRGTAFQSDWLYNLNLDAVFTLPTEIADAFIRVSVLNVLNLSQELDFEERGTLTSGAPRADYQQVTVYQAPRSVRLQLGVNF